MAGPLAGMSAAEIAKQKLADPAQQQQAQKQGPSKFDQALKTNSPDQIHATQAVAGAQQAHKVEHLRQIEVVQGTEKSRLDKVQTQGVGTQTGGRADPVSQKAEVSKTTAAIQGLFANIEKGQ